VKRRAAPGGFTLLEVAVAVALSVIVIGAATTVLSAVLVQNKRQRIQSDLQRDAELVGQLLATELRQAGLGVPQGPHIQKNCPGGVCTFTYGTGANTTSAGLRFGAHRLLVAAPTEIGLVGDLPRPDSNYPVFGPLHSRHSGAGTPPFSPAVASTAVPSAGKSPVLGRCAAWRVAIGSRSSTAAGTGLTPVSIRQEPSAATAPCWVSLDCGSAPQWTPAPTHG
jgi:prepilin-type N-terminal cleavage/methylation domain-containing protein